MPWMVPLVIIILLLLTSTIKVVREYERLVVFRLGHIIGVGWIGNYYYFIDRVIKVRCGCYLDVPLQGLSSG